MKKLMLMLLAMAMSVAMMMPTVFAAPLVDSATEQPPEVEVYDPNVPLDELDLSDPAVPLDDLDLDDPTVPLSDVPMSPQTGVTGPSGLESMSLMAVALAVFGIMMLAKAKKQAGPGR